MLPAPRPRSNIHRYTRTVRLGERDANSVTQGTATTHGGIIRRCRASPECCVNITNAALPSLARAGEPAACWQRGTRRNSPGRDEGVRGLACVSLKQNGRPHRSAAPMAGIPIRGSGKSGHLRKAVGRCAGSLGQQLRRGTHAGLGAFPTATATQDLHTLYVHDEGAW